MINDIIEPKTIDSSSNIKGTEKIETIYPETIEIPTYDYGNSQNTLDYEVALRRKPNLSTVATTGDYNDLINTPTIPTAGGQVKRGQSTVTGLGSLSITGIGFKPKTIIVNAWLSGVNKGWSNGSADISSNSCKYQYYVGGNIQTGNTGVLAYCYEASLAQLTAFTFTSFDTDGFTVNVTQFSAGTINFERIAFG